MAPGLGLYLDELFFEGYNTKQEAEILKSKKNKSNNKGQLQVAASTAVEIEIEISVSEIPLESMYYNT